MLQPILEKIKLLNIPMPQPPMIQCLLAAAGSFFLISWLRIRPLGIFFLGVFAFWFLHTRCHLHIVPPPEFKKKFQLFAERLNEFRQTKPTMFCAISTGCLGALALIGHLISGSSVVILGLVVAFVVSTKYNFKLVKIEPKDFYWSEQLNHDPELDDEFMPDVNETNLFVLERASDLATISSPTDDAAEEDEEKSDEIPSELLLKDKIPEIGESSTDEDDEDLVPLVKNKNTQIKANNSAYKNAQSNISKISTTNDDDQTEVMEFKKGHFKRDSSLSTTSSSSEESLSKGLQFPDHTMLVDGPTKSTIGARQLTSSAVGASTNVSSTSSSTLPHNQDASDLMASVVKTQTQALLANSGKLLPSLMSGIMQWGMNAATGGGSTTTPVNEQQTINTNTQQRQPTMQQASTSYQRRVVTTLDSSDESDFEIVENEDYK